MPGSAQALKNGRQPPDFNPFRLNNDQNRPNNGRIGLIINPQLSINNLIRLINDLKGLKNVLIRLIFRRPRPIFHQNPAIY